MISETKPDDSFPQGQFLIDDFHSPFRFDRNKSGCGILLYVRGDILTKILSHDFPSAESFFVEIILHKKKWLINSSYNPHKNNIKHHLETISRTFDTFSTKYENVLLLGDFNTCVDDEAMKNFCSSYCLNSLIKQPTCFKNPENPSCIDLILANKTRSLQSTCVIETGLSNFHRILVNCHQKLLVIGIFKILKMKGLLLPCNQLLKVKISITLKILTYSLRSVRKYLIIMLLEKKSAYVEIINLS